MKQCTRQQRGLPAEALAKAGFTLVELLMVIGIIGVLAAIVVVAINPTKQLGSARDTKRRSEVNSILNAVSQYAIDHGGKHHLQRNGHSLRLPLPPVALRHIHHDHPRRSAFRQRQWAGCRQQIVLHRPDSGAAH